MLISDMNLLYDAYKLSMRGSSWKQEVQLYEHDWLYQNALLQKELEDHTYVTSKPTEFILNERGKTRHIFGSRVRDRIVRHSLCDNVLGPAFKPYLIPNNGANQKGKGTSHARKEFEKALHNYYLKSGHNKGYVGFLDFSKFYDNIIHDEAKCQSYPIIPEENHWILDEIFNKMEIDVSYMSNDEYTNCVFKKFDSVEYYDTIPNNLRTGDKMMAKSCNIGDQVSQDYGVFFPHTIDNYAKIVLGLKDYGRFVDDIWFICDSKKEGYYIINKLTEQIESQHLFLNYKKTRVVPMNKSFKFLQTLYWVNDTGKVIKRINPKCLTRERQRLKGHRRLLDKNIMTQEEIYQCFHSWMGMYCKIMSKRQIKNIKNLYKELFERR